MVAGNVRGVDSYEYLGVIFTKDDSSKIKITRRIRQGRGMQNLGARLKIGTTITDKVDTKRLRRNEHVCRLSEERWPKQIMNCGLQQWKKRGRPSMTCRDV